MLNSKPILLVEDDRVDMMTFERALKDLRVTNPLAHSSNGEEALDYLRTENNKKPCLIFVDLNMPRMNGIEFLKTVKADKMLRKIPVVVLTTSKNEKDVMESFEACAAGYVVKPADYQKFVEAIRTINLYWDLSELPSEG
jgi:CheY-like chemotaxis protein